MSLINEALKEARHEATRQDAIRQGGLYPRLPFHGPQATRRRHWWIAIVAVILVAAGIGAGWWWRTTATPGDEVTAGVPPAVEIHQPGATVSDARESESEPPAQSEPMPQPVEKVAIEPMIDTTPTVTPPAPRDSEASAEPVVATDKPVAAEQASLLPQAPRSPYVPDTTPPASTDPVTFRREARLEDGTRLSLGGIAWSPSQPVALINGRVMEVGEITEGFALQEVKRGYVYLKRRDQVVILTLE